MDARVRPVSSGVIASVANSAVPCGVKATCGSPPPKRISPIETSIDPGLPTIQAGVGLGTHAAVGAAGRDRATQQVTCVARIGRNHQFHACHVSIATDQHIGTDQNARRGRCGLRLQRGGHSEHKCCRKDQVIYTHEFSTFRPIHCYAMEKSAPRRVPMPARAIRLTAAILGSTWYSPAGELSEARADVEHPAKKKWKQTNRLRSTRR